LATAFLGSVLAAAFLGIDSATDVLGMMCVV